MKLKWKKMFFLSALIFIASGAINSEATVKQKQELLIPNMLNGELFDSISSRVVQNVGYKPIKEYKKAKPTSVNPEDFIDNKYAFSPRWTENTKATKIGEGRPVESKYNNGDMWQFSKIGTGVKYTSVGYFKGKSVDLTITLDSNTNVGEGSGIALGLTSEGFFDFELWPGKASDGGPELYSKVNVKYTYSDNNEEVSIPQLMTQKFNVNKAVDYGPIENVKQVFYESKDEYTVFKEYEDYLSFTGVFTAAGETVTTVLDNSASNFSIGIRYQMWAGNPEASVQSALGYQYNGNQPINLVNPVLKGNKKSEKMSYIIEQQLAIQPESQNYAKQEWRLNINEILDVETKDISIKNKFDADITKEFDITFDDKSRELKLSLKNALINDAAFLGKNQEIVFYVPVKIKPGVDYTKYVDKENQTVNIPSKALYSVGSIWSDAQSNESDAKETIRDVKVEYLDKTTNEPVSEKKVINLIIGESYKEEPIEIAKYTLAKPLPENAEGTMAKENITVTYYYEKTQGKVISHYVDNKGNPILDDQIHSDILEAPFLMEPKSIDDYVYFKTEGAPSGNITEKDQEVTFVYMSQKDTFKLEQKVFNEQNTSVNQGKIKQGETLSYTLGLTLAKEVQDLNYIFKSASVLTVIDPSLENVRDVVLKDSEGNVVGSPVYNEDTNTITSELTTTNLETKKEIILSYKATVNESGEVGDFIREKGTADVSIEFEKLTNTVKGLESNEVETEIEAGKLEFISAPTTVDFGKSLMISFKDEIYEVEKVEGDGLVVQDNRLSGSKWTMGIELLNEMTSDEGDVLPDVLYYQGDTNDILVTETSQIIQTTTNETGELVNLSDQWSEKNGLRLKVKAGLAKATSYTGAIQWTLRDTP